jgi:esterase/lipase superfamily enzyme
MLRRPFFVVGVLALSATVGNAQPSPDENVLACKIVSGASLTALEKRKASLEQEVALKTPAKSDSRSNTKEREQVLRKLQEDLLQLLFEIDCLNTKLKVQESQQAPPSRGMTVAAKPSGVVEVTTYYATNRKQTASAQPTRLYGPEVGSKLQYGRAIVTIPPSHIPGNLELPTLWKVEREADTSKHFVLKGVMPLEADGALKEMAEKLEGMSSKALLIFVHGFKSGFSEAAVRTAHLAHNLKFPGMAFFYSWPSANQVRAYWQDEEVARLSEGVFEQLIEELSQLPVTDIYVVAHSMGNRIVGHALQARVDKGKETKKLKELLLAAPDINVDVFRTVIAPKLAAMRGTRTTVYASSSDIALRASKVVHRFRRVGETTGGVVTYPGIETIDASNASTATTLGHSLLVASPSVVKDIQSIVARGGPPRLRGLMEFGAAPNIYWRLR